MNKELNVFESMQKIKLLIDENLSRKLLANVSTLFPGSIHVSSVNLLMSTDTDIWVFAKHNEYCILTKDWDYRFLSLTYGCPPKVIRMNCGNQATEYIIKVLKDKIETILEFFDDTDLCYLEIE